MNKTLPPQHSVRRAAGQRLLLHPHAGALLPLGGGSTHFRHRRAVAPAPRRRRHPLAAVPARTLRACSRWSSPRWKTTATCDNGRAQHPSAARAFSARIPALPGQSPEFRRLCAGSAQPPAQRRHRRPLCQPSYTVGLSHASSWEIDFWGRVGSLGQRSSRPSIWRPRKAAAAADRLTAAVASTWLRNYAGWRERVAGHFPRRTTAGSDEQSIQAGPAADRTPVSPRAGLPPAGPVADRKRTRRAGLNVLGQRETRRPAP